MICSALPLKSQLMLNSGSFHMLFSLPTMLFPPTFYLTGSSSSFRSYLKCYILLTHSWSSFTFWYPLKNISNTFSIHKSNCPVPHFLITTVVKSSKSDRLSGWLSHPGILFNKYPAGIRQSILKHTYILTRNHEKASNWYIGLARKKITLVNYYKE